MANQLLIAFFALLATSFLFFDPFKTPWILPHRRETPLVSSSFVPTFLVRHHGLSVRDAGALSGLMFGMFGGLGILLGGWVGDRVPGSQVAHQQIRRCDERDERDEQPGTEQGDNQERDH